MKKPILTSIPFLLLLLTLKASSQNLETDQNPDFAISREKYMNMADSINRWHSTTSHQTYKAYDWYESRMERRAEDRRFRRDLRLQRNRYYYQPYRQPYRSRNYYRPYAPWGYWWW